MDLYLTEKRVLSTLQDFLDRHPFQANVKDYLVGSVPKTGFRTVTYETYFILPTEAREELIIVKVNTFHPNIIEGYRVIATADIIGFSASKYIRGYQVRLRTSDGYYIKMVMGKGSRKHTPLLASNLADFLDTFVSLGRRDFSNPQLDGVWRSLSKAWYNLDMSIVVLVFAFFLSALIRYNLPYDSLALVYFLLTLLCLVGLKRLLLVTPRKDTL